MIADDIDQYLRYLLGINAEQEANTIYCSSTVSPPTIDGVLSPEEWPEAAFIKELSYHNKITEEDEKHLMIFYCVHDEENLYIAIRVTDDDFPPTTNTSEANIGEPFITVPELFLKEQLIPALQQLFLFLLKPKG